jgi:peptide/nickel transport system permease protein
MLSFILRRIFTGVVLIVVVTALTFLLIYAGGSNVAANLLGENASADEIAAKAAQLGLDRPLVLQYGEWLGRALTGDLGSSYFTGQAVAASLLLRMPVTLSLVAVSLVLIVLVGVVLGVAQARIGGPVDATLQVGSVVGFALPSYLIALGLVVFVALPMPGVFPATGYTPIEDSFSGWIASITLPAIALAVGGVAAISTQIRGAILDVLRTDYIRTLRSRGVSARTVFFQNALRNASGPALTVLSLQTIGMLGGAVIIERIFALPGVGELAINASLVGDVPIVMAVVGFLVVVVVVVNLIVDLLQGWINPKARIGV